MSRQEDPPSREESYPGCDSIIREGFKMKGVPEDAMEVMLSSIAASTRNQYNRGIQLWWNFCKKNNLSLFSSPTLSVLQFLTETLEETASYSTLNVYRSALSLIRGNELGKDPQILRFFKGVANKRPQKARYQTTWDPNTVLEHLSTLHPNENLSLEVLTKKLVTLLALITAQRVQTLQKISLDNILQVSPELIQIKIPEKLKTSGRNKLQPVLNIPVYNQQPEICVASTLQAYVERTASLRVKQK